MNNTWSSNSLNKFLWESNNWWRSTRYWKTILVKSVETITSQTLGCPRLREATGGKRCPVLYHTEHRLLQTLRAGEGRGRKDYKAYSLHITLLCMLDACATHCKILISYLGSLKCLVCCLFFCFWVCFIFEIQDVAILQREMSNFSHRFFS